MKKIAIVAGPSMGKTVTALLLGVRLKMMAKEVHFVLEYATNYIIRNGAPKNVFEQLAIFCEQQDEEGYIEKAQTADYLVCDSASFLACVYARHYKPRNTTKEDVQKYHYVLKTMDKWARERALAFYDFIFFLPAELEFKKNSVRWQSGKEEAQKISDEIESYLTIEGAKYHRISGSPEERVEQILEILAEADLSSDLSSEVLTKEEVLPKEEASAKEEEKENNTKIFPMFE